MKSMNNSLALCALVAATIQMSAAEPKQEPKPSRSQQSAKYSVRASAVVQKDPPQIQLQWPKTASPCQAHVIYRRFFGGRKWSSTPAAVLDGDATGFVDKQVKLGVQYEYRVDRLARDHVGRGYLCAGIELPMVEDRGIVLLLVESGVAKALAVELERLRRDLIGDGWRVIRQEIGRDDSVDNTRAVIRDAWSGSDNELRSVFLLGHVPVPYSGSISPDGHKNHKGAWPADLVYADVDGEWTDTKTHKTFTRGNQENIPGDGKFDQNTIAPNSLELEVGRVDLANMPAFKLNEVELLRRYLQRNHDFRHGRITAPAHGLIDDHFGGFRGEAFGWSGWSNFAAFFGAENLDDKDWFSTLPKTAYLWAYGCGGGSFTRANGVGNTSDFATKGSRAVFTMLFGSYFGDWNEPDNFMRAPLAAEGFGLTCAWAGRPHWIFHPMALGKNIGYCALRTQANNSIGDYPSPDDLRLTKSGKNDDSEWDTNPIHVALMGDPTLRLHPVPPPIAATVVKTDEGWLLRWKPGTAKSFGSDVTYLVYRASSSDGTFRRLTKTSFDKTKFLDHEIADTSAVYLIKTRVLQSTSSGTYFNTSQGLFLERPE
jgi:hypothetical protein